MTTPYTLTFCRIAVALVFALTVVGKAQNVTAFQEAILDFQLLPPNWSKALAWTFLSTEALVVLLMVIGGSILLPGFLLAIVLLLSFAIALVLVLRRNKRVACNCFGRTERHISSYDVVRNLLLTACSLLGIWALLGPQQNLSINDVLLVGLMAACFVTLVTGIADVVETLRQPFHVI